MTTIHSFVNRLKKIGIEVELTGNYPWIYLDKVNRKKVEGKLFSEYGFTVFFLASRTGEKDTITEIPTIFKKIRETLEEVVKVRVKVSFPQIVFDNKNVDITEEEWDDLITNGIDERVEFIWNQMTDNEQNWCPDGKKGLKAAMDVDYAFLKKL